VVVMELVVDAEGNPAPRLGDLSFEAREAREIYQQLLREVTRMLSAGVIHGDLSEFNVLMGTHGPVLIDFPQSINAAHSQSARKFLLRDVENLHRFADRHASGQPTLPYGEEMWSLYEAGRLEADSELRGDYRALEAKADTSEVLALIEDADREESDRRAARGEAPRTEGARPLRTVVDLTKEARPRWSGAKRASGGRKAGRKSAPSGAAQKPTSDVAAVEADTRPKKRRSRRRSRRKRNAVPGGQGGGETSVPGSGRATASAQKKAVGSGDGETSKRRRRARRGVSRSVTPRREPKCTGGRQGRRTDRHRAIRQAGGRSRYRPSFDRGDRCGHPPRTPKAKAAPERGVAQLQLERRRTLLRRRIHIGVVLLAREGPRAGRDCILLGIPHACAP